MEGDGKLRYKVTGRANIGEAINCPDPDESRDERRGAVSSQAGAGASEASFKEF